MKYICFMVSIFLAYVGYAQSLQPSLCIGHQAPELKVTRWIKGPPVKQFDRGKVYVLDLWATWCRPCIASMPHLSKLARKYQNQVTFIAISIKETRNNSLKKINHFVDSMGNRMDFSVAWDSIQFIMNNWLNACGEEGIPTSFIVDQEGKFAWVGHPAELNNILPKIVNGQWNLSEELERRKSNSYLTNLDNSVRNRVIDYIGDVFSDDDYIGHPDTVLLKIDTLLKKEPALKYAPEVAFYTFSALLKTDMEKAYNYGKLVLETPTYQEPAYTKIINVINLYTDKLKLSKKIYELGAAAYQQKINNFKYPEMWDVYYYFSRMAAWYWLAGDRSKAVENQEKAIADFKNRKKTQKDLTELKAQLKKYQEL